MYLSVNYLRMRGIFCGVSDLSTAKVAVCCWACDTVHCFALLCLSVIPVKNIRQLLMTWALPSLRAHYKSAHLLQFTSLTYTYFYVCVLSACFSVSPAMSTWLVALEMFSVVFSWANSITSQKLLFVALTVHQSGTNHNYY